MTMDLQTALKMVEDDIRILRGELRPEDCFMIMERLGVDSPYEGWYLNALLEVRDALRDSDFPGTNDLGWLNLRLYPW